MDPGTALAIASLVYDVSKDLYDYYRAWRHCDKDVADARVQLLWLHNAFKVTRDILRQPDLSLEAVKLVYGALSGCNDAANELRYILEKVKKDGTPQSVLAKLKAQGRRALYPFRKPTVAAIVEQIELCQEELHFAVSLLHLDTTGHTFHALHELDKKLVYGFENLDNALKQLPAVISDLRTIKSQTTALKTDTENIESIVKDTSESAAFRVMLDWLCKEDYSLQQGDAFSEKQGGTGRWFLECPIFEVWFQGNEKTLVCPGQPGAGKTVMAAMVIDHICKTTDPADVGLAYLFCNYKRRNEQSLTHLLRAMLRQLVYLKAHAPASIVDMYATHEARNTVPSKDELRTALVSVVRQFSRVYIVIDALDECERAARTQLLSVVSDLQIGGTVHLLATSRNIPEILNHFAAAPVLEVRASDDDVAVFLWAHMSELPQCVQDDPELQSKMVKTIVEAVHGMFLLARFHKDSLNDKMTVKSVKSALRNLPSGSDTDIYSQVYRETMERIRGQPKGKRSLAEEALAWVVLAQRPLDAEEFRHALAIETDDDDTSGLDPENLLPVDVIISLCAGVIVKDDQSNTIRLVHYTAQSFFDDAWPEWIPNAATTIAQKCIKYLSFEVFGQGPDRRDEEMDRRFTTHPLLRYSATYWGVHLFISEERSGTDGNPRLYKSLLRFLNNASLVLSATQAALISKDRYVGYASHYPYSSQGPHLAARFGTVHLLNLMQESNFELDCRDMDFQTPLCVAASDGREAVVSWLVRTNQVELDPRDSYDRTPLWLAASNGHERVVELLLRTGQVDVNCNDGFCRTLLQQAVDNGHEAVVELLLEMDQLNVNPIDGEAATPLCWAALKGHTAIVKRLLQDGRVNVDYKRPSGPWPEPRPDERVELVWKYKHGTTPLYWAAYNGHDAVVKLLIETGQVDVDMRDEAGKTPLWWAAFKGHTAIVELLLGTGQVEVDLKDASGTTSLWWAAFKGHDAIVKLLLETGQVDIECRDQFIDTLSWLTALPSSMETASLVMGANQCAVDGRTRGGQITEYEGCEGQAALVEKVCARHELHLDCVDVFGKTPLWWAESNGHAAVVKLLLENGADRRVLEGKKQLALASERTLSDGAETTTTGIV